VTLEVVGRVELSGSKRSLKIVLDDRILDNVFYVSLIDVQRCIKEPKFAAQVVKVKDDGC
jgi:hypothetical protein